MPPRRPCLEPGCPAITTGTRCPAHTAARQQQRGTTSQRGYGTTHQQLRTQLLATYQPSDPCARCGQPLGPDPTLIDLGHTDDRRGYTGLEHRWCNRSRRAS